MTWPLRILALGSVVVGFVGLSPALTFGRDVNWFEHLLRGVAPGVEVEHAPALTVEWGLIALSVAVALAGIALAGRFYTGLHAYERPQRLAARFPTLYTTIANKYYVDEIYDRIIVRPLRAVADFSWRRVDTLAIDGTLNTTAFLTEMAGDGLRFLQTGNVRNYALFVLAGALAAAVWLLL